MTRVRLSVDISPELKKRIKLAAVNNDMTVREWMEHALTRALERQDEVAWMEGDLSRMSEIEPYEWQEGELEEGDPIRYIPGRGYVVVREKKEV